MFILNDFFKTYQKKYVRHNFNLLFKFCNNITSGWPQCLQVPNKTTYPFIVDWSGAFVMWGSDVVARDQNRM